MRGTLHRYGGQWDLKGHDVREKRIVGLIGSGILLAEVRFPLTAQVRLRKLEDEAFPLAKWADFSQDLAIRSRRNRAHQAQARLYLPYFAGT